MQSNLDRIGENNAEAKRIIEQVRSDYNVIPYVEPVELDPALDRTLEDILLGMSEPPEEP